eukprot:m.575930 g.575930  ORF g.575930 m.575930 type:complete len:269 (+) comp22285_c0_seq28:200-1006(+)
MARAGTQELIYDDDGASHVPAGGHAKHIHVSDDGDFIYDFCHTESVYDYEDLGRDASHIRESCTDIAPPADLSRSESDDYEAPIDEEKSDEHEPLTYDEIDSDVPSDSREEYEQLQETYDTVAEDRSELQALDNEEKFYAEKELVPQRWCRCCDCITASEKTHICEKDVKIVDEELPSTVIFVWHLSLSWKHHPRRCCCWVSPLCSQQTTRTFARLSLYTLAATLARRSPSHIPNQPSQCACSQHFGVCFHIDTSMTALTPQAFVRMC